MGVIIPLFQPRQDVSDLRLDPEQQLRVKLIQNAMEALRREEKAVEKAITDKCRDEIERLNAIDNKMRQMELELDDLCLVGRHR